MCGIAGYAGPRAAEQAGRVGAMLQAIAHRGPDNEGLWNDGDVALGHRRLSIIDTSASGNQPMVSASERFVLGYNGEIYNYLELRQELAATGIRFTSDSDSEVLLAAFEAWGERCVQRFNGMWAFVIWDRQARRLFASRDRFGEKPFYYVVRDGGFWFASEIKALLAAGVAERRVNPAAVADFAVDRVSDHTCDTFFANVRQLGPASSAWLDGDTLRSARYWALPTAAGASDRPGTPEQIGALLQDAVRLRLRSDVDVGVLLSGGLDSSAVACLAAGQRGNSINAFSTIDQQPPEEARGIAEVLAMYPSLLQHVDTPPADTLERDMAQCLWHQEEPFADGSMLAHYRLMRLARDSGVRVLLTGQAADEVFAGYPGFQSIHVGGLVRNGRFGAAWRHIQAMRHTGQPVPLGTTLGNSLPPSLARWLRRRRADASMHWLAPEFRAGSSVMEGYAGRSDDAVNTALNECLQRRTLPGFLHYEDRNAMAFGVETRIPFLDHRLVELVLPLPGAAKLAGGKTKALLRDAVDGVVPATIIGRLAKQGYPAPLARWLRGMPPSQRSAQVDLVAQCPLIHFAAWQRNADRFFAGDEAALSAVWRGWVLAAWHDRFIRAG